MVGIAPNRFSGSNVPHSKQKRDVFHLSMSIPSTVYILASGILVEMSLRNDHSIDVTSDSTGAVGIFPILM
jgi:hypothetical protein